LTYVMVSSEVEDFPAKIWAALTLISGDNVYLYESQEAEDTMETLTSSPFVEYVVLDYPIASLNNWELVKTIKDPVIGWPHMKVTVLYEDIDQNDALEAWDAGTDLAIERDTALSDLARHIVKRGRK